MHRWQRERCSDGSFLRYMSCDALSWQDALDRLRRSKDAEIQSLTLQVARLSADGEALTGTAPALPPALPTPSTAGAVDDSVLAAGRSSSDALALVSANGPASGDDSERHRLAEELEKLRVEHDDLLVALATQVRPRVSLCLQPQIVDNYPHGRLPSGGCCDVCGFVAYALLLFRLVVAKCAG